MNQIVLKLILWFFWRPVNSILFLVLISMCYSVNHERILVITCTLTNLLQLQETLCVVLWPHFIANGPLSIKYSYYFVLCLFFFDEKHGTYLKRSVHYLLFHIEKKKMLVGLKICQYLKCWWVWKCVSVLSAMSDAAAFILLVHNQWLWTHSFQVKSIGMKCSWVIAPVVSGLQ